MDAGEILLNSGVVSSFSSGVCCPCPSALHTELRAACEAAAHPRDVTSCPAFQGLKENR